jgi:hypothetical protein
MLRPRPACDAPTVGNLLQSYRPDRTVLFNPPAILHEGKARGDHDISKISSMISRDLDMPEAAQCHFLHQGYAAAACLLIGLSAAAPMGVAAICARLQRHSVAISWAALLPRAYSVTPSPAAIAS